MQSAALCTHSEMRLARYDTQIRLHLLYFVGRLIAWYGLFAPLPREAERFVRGWLDHAAYAIACNILLRAFKRVRQRQFGRSRPASHVHQRHARRGADMRAMLGCALRRALKRRNIGAQIEAMFALMQNPERCVAKLARRLARLLTRRRPIRPRAVLSAPLLTAPLAPILCADTS